MMLCMRGNLNNTARVYGFQLLNRHIVRFSKEPTNDVCRRLNMIFCENWQCVGIEIAIPIIKRKYNWFYGKSFCAVDDLSHIRGIQERVSTLCERFQLTVQCLRIGVKFLPDSVS